MTDRQTRLGIAPGAQRLTTNAQALAYVSRIRDAGANRTQAMEQVTNEITSLYGSQASRALAEVARAGEMPELGALAAVTDPQARRRVARAIAAPEPQLADPHARRDAARMIDNQFAALGATLSNTPGGAERLQTARDAALRTALSLVAAGDNPGHAGRVAAADFLGQYQFRANLRIPRAWSGQPVDAGRVLNGADIRLRELAESGQAILPAGRGDANARDRSAATADTLRAGTRWVTAPNDAGLILVDEWGDAVRRRVTTHGPGGRSASHEEEVTASWSDLLNADRANPEPLLVLPRG